MSGQRIWPWINVIGFGLTVSLIAPAVGRADPSTDEWKAPASADTKKNPTSADDKSIRAGKTAYLGNCLACHGATGKGDGPASAALPHKPGDLSSEKTLKQSDGALFWKITNGLKPMPPFDKQMTDTARWNVVNYIRTFAPPAK